MKSSLKFACLLAVLASCLGQSEAFAFPKNPTDGEVCLGFVTENLSNLLEELRERMDLPIDRFDLPPVDPLQVELLSLSGSDLLAGIQTDIHNVSFVGINRFEANNLIFNMSEFDISLQLVVPLLQISGHHVSNGSLYGLVPVIGEGPVNLNVSNLVFDISGRLDHINNEWVAIGVRVNFTISGITGAFENLTDNFFNDLLNLSGPEILELAWPGLEPAVVEIVGDAVGTFLNGFTMIELLGMLFGNGIDWSDVDSQRTTVQPQY